MNCTILGDDQVSELWQDILQEGAYIIGGCYRLQNGYQRGNLTEVLKRPKWRRT